MVRIDPSGKTSPPVPPHLITWAQLAEFAREIDREITHVFRVFKGERESPPIAEEFQRHFGFGIRDAALAGYRRRRARAA